MHTVHTLETTIDLPIRVRITFRHHPGCPAEGPSYSSGGTPASPGEIDGEVIEIIVAGQAYPVKDVVAALIAGYCREDMEFLAEEEVREASEEAADRRAA